LSDLSVKNSLSEENRGARGGSRTRTGISPLGILSPVCLPFHHSGCILTIGTYQFTNKQKLELCHFSCHFHKMNVLPPLNPEKAKRQMEGAPGHGRGGYQKVHDRSNRPVRGLWQRNGSFYVRVAAADPVTGLKKMLRVRLEGVETVADATKKLHETRKSAAEGAISRTRIPTFGEYLSSYFSTSGGKAPATVDKEKAILKRWSQTIGRVRLNKITPMMIRHQLGKRERDGKAGRTINLDLIALRCVLKQARSDGHIQALPTLGIQSYKTDQRSRRLIEWSEVEAICAAAKAASKNGDQFSDYILLLAFAGSRRTETLRIRWSHVDFQKELLVFPNELEKGRDGSKGRPSQTKNRRNRVINFNEELRRHLEDMRKRKAPDSDWLFPSPQRGERDVPAKTFTETLKLARDEASLPEFNFHDLRHYFISSCVMAGIDFMTIAKWVGHQDGGVLIGKVYGHLADTHSKNQAAKVSLAKRHEIEATA
jgi:integrase